MRTIILSLALILTTSLSYCQWETVGSVFYGEHNTDLLGNSLSLNANGDVLAMYDAFGSGTSQGRVRVYELQNGEWIQLGDDILGITTQNEGISMISLNAIGDRLAFASPGAFDGAMQNVGVTRVFELQANQWNQIGNDIWGELENDYLGHSLDMSDLGDIIVLGAIQAPQFTNLPGYVEVYQYLNGNWSLLGNRFSGVVNGDYTGDSVSINGQGDIVAFSSPLSTQSGIFGGKVESYSWNNGEWMEYGNTIIGETNGAFLGGRFAQGGNAIELSRDGNKLIIGATGFEIPNEVNGQAKVYEILNGNWEQIGNDINSTSENVFFGTPVHINNDGNIILISDLKINNDIGESKVFKLFDNNWIQFDDTIQGDGNPELLGYASAMNSTGEIIVVGAPFNDDIGLNHGRIEVLQNDAILTNGESITPITFQINPNPNQGNFTIKFEKTVSNIKMEIVDASGKLLMSEEFLNSKEVDIDHSLSAGIYFVTVSKDGVTSTHKIIVN